MMQQHDNCLKEYPRWDDGIVFVCRRARGHHGDHQSLDPFDRPTFRWP